MKIKKVELLPMVLVLLVAASKLGARVRRFTSWHP